MRKIHISNGNSKMGAIPSVSLPPIQTCKEGCPCASKCYAAKLAKFRPNVMNAYQENFSLWEESPEGFEIQVAAAAFTTRYFRWHVAGDILNDAYFKMMCNVARRCTGTNFLAFTKRWDIVNQYTGEIPSNLKIIYSAWGDYTPDNPHNFPVSHVIFKGNEPEPNWKICGGNCTECACRGVGCWELNCGEHIAFYEH